MKTYDYDLLILGAGPGGYVSAIRASQLQMKVALIEKDKTGGVCLNTGCIPSKALIHQGEIFSHIAELKKMGIQIDTSHFDYTKVHSKSRKAATVLSKGVQYLLKKNGIQCIKSEGQLESPHEVILSDGKILSAKFIIIATGSSSKELSSLPFDEEVILSSTGMLMQTTLPKRLLILGAGAIGVEFAHIMNAFGVEVYLVEALDQILPLEDSDIVKVVSQSFKQRKINLLTSTQAISATKPESGIIVQLAEKEGKPFELDVDQLLVSVGRTANIKNIGLETVNIDTEHGFIPVGDYYQTVIDSIYAIGDVINTPQLAHVASKEGEIAVEHIAGLNRSRRIDPLLIPSGVYCEPQVASFGYMENRLQKENIAYKKAVFPYKGVGKAVSIEQSVGMIKLLYSPVTKEILGTHIVGSQATELIHPILLAKKNKLLPKEIASMIHAHPTLSELLMEVMKVVEGEAIHI